MKKILTAACIMVSFFAAAQNKSGKINYEETIKLTIKLEGADAQFANMLPKEQKSKKILVFNENAALFKALENDAEQEIKQQTQDGGMMQIKMAKPDEQYYYDLKADRKTEQRDFMGRKFLIELSNEAGEWKLSGNQKEVLGYACQEATKTDTSGQVTSVWFAPAIAVKAGPMGIGNLPGAVLELTMRDGNYTIVATSVSFEAIDDKMLVKPKSGKKVSADEYKAIVAEKRKEMEKEFGTQGGGQFIMKVEHDVRN